MTLGVLTWPPDDRSLNSDARALALGALTVAVPVIPALFAALVFDLGLVMRSEGRRFDTAVPVGPIAAAALAYTAPLLVVGFLAIGSAMNEWPGPLRYESLCTAAFVAAFPVWLFSPIWLPLVLIVFANRSPTSSRGR